MTRLLPIVLLVLGAAPLAAAAGLSEPHAFALGDGYTAALAVDGTLSWSAVGAADAPPLLQLRWSVDEPIRGAVPAPDFLGAACEGDPGGRRGFAATADDDDDGQTDEDRLDGRDNDGDGLVDEDFAAIGHAMVVWDRVRPTWSRHLEAYHWSYPSLQSLVAVTLQQSGSGLVDPVELLLPADADWLAVDRTCAQTGAEAGGPVFLSRLAATADRPECWLGVVVLDRAPRARAAQRLRAEAGRLTLPLVDRRLTIVVACGTSRLQVVDDLMSAAALRAGMTDPVTHTTVRWIPRPDTLLPVERGRIAVAVGGPSAELQLTVADQQAPDLDPDRWSTDLGRRLTVTELAWRPTDGPPVTLPWPGRLLESAPLCPPDRLLGVEGPGVLVFTLDGPAPVPGERLIAHRVDGRPLTFDVEAAPAPTGPADAAPAQADDPTTFVRLSPQLLSNYPNPFRESTSISYRVPATVGEAFDLDGPDAPDLDPARAMPYAASPPLVQVSIFSLEGRSVATLRTDRQGPGLYEATWNGRDEQGRAVPSGAYFCKLQIENWSVTKRLIFVR
ncbi:MAG: FlgD immunoglobulin-like domain containing protein [Candidatus Krumholzibacteriia bacterium]